MGLWEHYSDGYLLREDYSTRHRFVHLLVIFFILLIAFSRYVYADDASSSAQASTSQQANDIRNRISELQNKISDLKGQEKTLSDQITSMDSKMTLTQLRIDATKQ